MEVKSTLYYNTYNIHFILYFIFTPEKNLLKGWNILAESSLSSILDLVMIHKKV